MPLEKQLNEDLKQAMKSGNADKVGVLRMLNAALKNKLKAMYIMGENPVISDPDASHTVEALKKLKFLVVQDIFMSETAELAHVVLPAVSFAEKEGTFQFYCAMGMFRGELIVQA